MHNRCPPRGLNALFSWVFTSLITIPFVLNFLITHANLFTINFIKYRKQKTKKPLLPFSSPTPLLLASRFSLLLHLLLRSPRRTMSPDGRCESWNGKLYPAALASHGDVVKDHVLFWDTLRRFHFMMGTKFMWGLFSLCSLNLIPLSHFSCCCSSFSPSFSLSFFFVGLPNVFKGSCDWREGPWLARSVCGGYWEGRLRKGLALACFVFLFFRFALWCVLSLVFLLDPHFDFSRSHLFIYFCIFTLFL